VGAVIPTGLIRLSLVVALSAAAPLLRADAVVPARQQADTLARVLSYDRRLRLRAGQRLTIAVAFNGRDPLSKAAADDMARALRGLPAGAIQGLQVSVVVRARRTRAATWPPGWRVRRSASSISRPV
jgi:hypothetical protein